ncbi:hypothetical protein AB0J35_44315 [Nonomuraea angiospora]|uniref:hypothetical protein n=1 Tax=Nonomuraea angiospora TaxID=46172 RepID=UPI00343FC839
MFDLARARPGVALMGFHERRTRAGGELGEAQFAAPRPRSLNRSWHSLSPTALISGRWRADTTADIDEEAIRLYGKPGLGQLDSDQVREIHLNALYEAMAEINCLPEGEPPSEMLRRLLAARAPASASREVGVQDSPIWTNVPPRSAWNALVRQ